LPVFYEETIVRLLGGAGGRKKRMMGGGARKERKIWFQGVIEVYNRKILLLFGQALPEGKNDCKEEKQKIRRGT